MAKLHIRSLILTCLTFAGCAQPVPTSLSEPATPVDKPLAQITTSHHSIASGIQHDHGSALEGDILEEALQSELMIEAHRLVVPICASGGKPDIDRKRFSQLMSRREALLPAFETIIADPKSPPRKVSGTFYALAATDSRSPHLVELANSRLADENYGVRCAALYYLERYGSARDARKVLLLLSDKDRGVRYSAAMTLAKIGDKHALKEMEAWLKDLKHGNDGDFIIHVKKCRDELEKRLKEHPVPKKLIN